MPQLAMMHYKIRRSVVLFFASLILAGCTTITLISSYDEPTDKALTELQQSTDNFITGLIEHVATDENAYSRHLEFYRTADQKLRRLEFRVSSIPSNGRTVKLVENIRTALLGSGSCNQDGTSLRDLHCSPDGLAAGPSRRALEDARRNINQTIGAALALELEKKMGAEPN